jgi:hypothetical protein
MEALTGKRKKSLVSWPLRKKLGRYFMALCRSTEMFWYWPGFSRRKQPAGQQQ